MICLAPKFQLGYNPSSGQIIYISFITYNVKKIISLRSDLLALILVTLAVIFVLVSPGQTIAAKNECTVCHNGSNPHTVIISCKNVSQYLANHPGDYAGPCQGVTKEKPPKKP